ncbi:M20/M25/M40 family metallo-hydrolase [Metabacillus sp. RGM 3146]|uniref:M20/M25/M40 family metallo-hydrolase n=1 Tax=Metabacillus sp. RGM 3146 TaxID=3401092 RepID=UPI003B9B5676
MAFQWKTKEKLTELLTKLVEYDSITGSEGEATFPEYVYYLLKDLDYYQQEPEHLTLHPIKDGRRFLTALVKKPGASKTIVLLSHFDVVDVQDYGDLKHLAFRPRELTNMFTMRKELLSDPVKTELETGDWLFGRGTMDMKAGLTVQIAMLERAMAGEFDGNLLLLTVPDEEANSSGMLAACEILNQLKKTHGLEYETCVNSEPMFTRYPNDQNYYIYTGSIGKILAGFFCYGKETHVGEPFSGLNATAMSAEISRLLELNEEYCEKAGDEVTPPPTCLLQKDLKDEYSVQIPHLSVSLYNLLIMRRPLSEVHTMLKKTALAAAEGIEKKYLQKAKAFSDLVSYQPDPLKVTVLSYKELFELAIEKAGRQEVERRIVNLTASMGGLDDRSLSIQIAAELSGLCKEQSPMIVLFYAPPYYPAVSSAGDERIEKTASDLKEYAKMTYNISLESINYFPGLSDLSFFQLKEGEESMSDLMDSMPLYGKQYTLPIKAIKNLNMPVINVGPVGRDAHQWTERVHLPYTFEKLPDLLAFTIQSIFKEPA